ncbi:MAG: TM2 domain-containing protein [Lachnospiraceae bacterium]|nr:TM2 domain-containing protein [Lachnospiraceae bacterium]
MDGNNNNSLMNNDDSIRALVNQNELRPQPMQQNQAGQIPTMTQTYTPPRMQPQYGQMPMAQQPMGPTTVYPLPGSTQTKYCKFCASVIPIDAVICTACGRQVETLAGQAQQTPQVINIQNSNTNNNNNNNSNMGGPMMVYGRPKDKLVSILLCLFTGWIGGHKFYEGKILMGVLYLFTAGLCGVGVLVDFIVLLTKPNPYYV